MIFVTVGTHEQPFNRLVKYIDDLKKKEIIVEDVIIQTGFCTYKPKYCAGSKLFPYQEMKEHVKNARIVITHGGPSSFIMPLQIGKVPIVVPRQKQYGEHVNNHQIEFCKAVMERQRNIIMIEDIKDLYKTVMQYESIIETMQTGLISNNTRFNEELKKIVNELFEKRK